MKNNGIDYQLKEGDGAFYGPKIDFDVVDAIGRVRRHHPPYFHHLDRFDLKYVGKDNEVLTPVVIHRAIFGSLERPIAILIEHMRGPS